MVDQKDDGIILPIEWHYPEGLVSRYATNIVVQHTDQEFIISFFEVLPPVVLGSPEEQKAKTEQIKSVRGECVARIIISVDRMPEFVEALQNNLEKYRSRITSRGAK